MHRYPPLTVARIDVCGCLAELHTNTKTFRIIKKHINCGIEGHKIMEKVDSKNGY